MLNRLFFEQIMINSPSFHLNNSEIYQEDDIQYFNGKFGIEVSTLTGFVFPCLFWKLLVSSSINLVMSSDDN